MSDFVQGINTGVQAANGFLQGRRKATADQLRIDIEEKEQKRKEKAATERSKLNEQRFMLNELNLASKRDEQEQEGVDQNYYKEKSSVFETGTPEQQNKAYAGASPDVAEDFAKILARKRAEAVENRALEIHKQGITKFNNEIKKSTQDFNLGKIAINSATLQYKADKLDIKETIKKNERKDGEEAKKQLQADQKVSREEAAWYTVNKPLEDAKNYPKMTEEEWLGSEQNDYKDGAYYWVDRPVTAYRPPSSNWDVRNQNGNVKEITIEQELIAKLNNMYARRGKNQQIVPVKGFYDLVKIPVPSLVENTHTTFLQNKFMINHNMAEEDIQDTMAETNMTRDAVFELLMEKLNSPKTKNQDK